MNVTLNSSNQIGRSGLIICDGRCGMCTVAIDRTRTVLERFGFKFAALQESWVSELARLDQTTLLQSIHLVIPDGGIYRRPDFFIYLTGKIWWLKPLH